MSASWLSRHLRRCDTTQTLGSSLMFQCLQRPDSIYFLQLRPRLRHPTYYDPDFLRFGHHQTQDSWAKKQVQRKEEISQVQENSKTCDSIYHPNVTKSCVSTNVYFQGQAGGIWSLKREV